MRQIFCFQAVTFELETLQSQRLKRLGF